MSTWAFLGDSVTAAGRDLTRPDDLGRGWVAEVSRRLHGRDPAARAVNLGVSGDRLADVRARALTDLAASGALVPGAVLTLAVGVNDVRRAHLDGHPLDLDGFAAGYAALLDEVASAVPGGPAGLVLVEPVLRPLEQEQQRWTADLDRVVDVVRSAARSTGALLVGARQALDGHPADHVTRDGFHPTAAGHQMIADSWWGAVGAAPGLLRPGRPRWWDRLRRR